MASIVHFHAPHPAARVALGLRALRGGAVCVAVAAIRDAPVIVLSRRLGFGGGEMHAGLYERGVLRLQDGADRAAVERDISAGRAEWEAAAYVELRELVEGLTDAGWAAARAALLVNRAGWVGDVLAYGLSSPEHARVAEGLAQREALRSALRAQGVETIEADEKSLRDQARAVGISPAIETAQLRAMGMKAGPPWRVEWKTAALAAWICALSLA